jgi:surface polysaccharide O-acyltransferase-like enzyme
MHKINEILQYKIIPHLKFFFINTVIYIIQVLLGEKRAVK